MDVPWFIPANNKNDRLVARNCHNNCVRGSGIDEISGLRDAYLTNVVRKVVVLATPALWN